MNPGSLAKITSGAQREFFRTKVLGNSFFDGSRTCRTNISGGAGSRGCGAELVTSTPLSRSGFDRLTIRVRLTNYSLGEEKFILSEIEVTPLSRSNYSRFRIAL